MKNLKSRLRIIFLLFLCFLTILVSNLPQILARLYVREYQQHFFNRPYLHTVPQARQLKPETLVASTEMTFNSMGLTVTVPWDEIVSHGERSAIKKIEFSNGKSLFLYDELEIATPPCHSPKLPGIQAKYSEYLIDWCEYENNFNLYRDMANATPKQLNIFDNLTELLKNYSLLLLKTVELIIFDDAMTIYAFQTDNIRGFQFGDPKITDTIDIVFFDANDNEFRLTLKASQKEIDFILSGIKKG